MIEAVQDRELDKNIRALALDLQKRGSDAPLHSILTQTQIAREELRKAYTGLQRAYPPVSEAAKGLMATGDALEPVMVRLQQGIERVQSAAGRMKETVGQMRTDDPDSTGERMDPSALDGIENLSPDVDSIERRFQEARQKAEDAGRALRQAAEQAAQRSAKVRELAAEIGGVESFSMMQLGGGTQGGRFERALMDAGSRLKAAAGKAEEAVSLLQDSEQRLGATLERAKNASEGLQNAKERLLQASGPVNRSHEAIREPIKQGYRCAQCEKKKQGYRDQAEEAKQKAQEAYEGSEKPAQEAKASVDSTRSSAEQTGGSLSRLGASIGAGPEPSDMRKLPLKAPSPQPEADASEAPEKLRDALAPIPPAQTPVEAWAKRFGSMAKQPPPPRVETPSAEGITEKSDSLWTALKDIVVPPARAGDAISRWEPLINNYSKKYGVDPDLVKAVIYAESGGDPNARSQAGAVGLMQLMPDTAKQYGVTRLSDPEQNIKAGVQHLAHLLKLYHGNKTLAVAAYNAGEGNVHGRVPAFPETQAYVERVMGRYRKLRG